MKKQYLTAIFLAVLTMGTFSTAQSVSAGTVCTDLKATLSLGMNVKTQGNPVMQLQDFLRAQGYLNSESTGYFGPITLRAVQAFQRARSISTIGSVGPLTRAEIKKISCVVAVTPSPAVSQAAQVITAVTPANIPKQSGQTLPYSTEIFSGWKGAWGNVSTTSENTLLIKSNPTQTSVEAFFDSSKDWTDYKYTASVNISNGNVMMIARRVDDANLLICEFIGNVVSIKQRIAGKETVVAQQTVTDMYSSPYFQKSMTVSMRVVGSTVGCTAVGNEDNVTYTKVDSRLLKGGIAIETWFEAEGSATLELRSINVTAL